MIAPADLFSDGVRVHRHADRPGAGAVFLSIFFISLMMGRRVGKRRQSTIIRLDSASCCSD